MPPPTLPDFLDQTWNQLVRGKHSAKHAFHFPVISTVRPDGLPAARVVVLREARRDDGVLGFHTDARAAKLDQLDAGVAFTFYDRGASLQIRATTRAVVLGKEETDARWAKTAAASRKCYLAQPAPGTAVDAYTTGFTGRLDGHEVPTLEETVPARENFTVVRAYIDTLEVLHIKRRGHWRARFRRDDAWAGTWLVP